jgi:hypothetical protein
MYFFDQRNRHDMGAALAVGILAHLPGDALSPILSGEFGRARFLLWPVLPSVYYPTSTFWEYVHLFFRNIVWVSSPEKVFAALLTPHFWIFVFSFLLWRVDGYPGLDRFIIKSRSK